ncbi:phage holin family protein [Agilicoccus flavus]|uniref:phage holin family protein n=1 Tax=Agilicoccus flavus TaxID=2775968 RepID=UPI001CF65ABF|nr:phage holin family protein [Agilicoccus flavus]
MATVHPEPKAPQAPRASDPTLGRLVNNALEDISTLIRNEIALAKAEISVDVKKIGIGAAMFAAAAFVAVLGLIFLLHTIAQGLIALGLAPWLSYLIVTLLLFVVAGVLALIGKSKVSKVQGKPQRTIAAAKTTIDEVKRSASGDATSTIRRTDPVAHGAAAKAPIGS